LVTKVAIGLLKDWPFTLSISIINEASNIAFFFAIIIAWLCLFCLAVDREVSGGQYEYS
jgi:hypothetical protein